MSRDLPCDLLAMCPTYNGTNVCDQTASDFDWKAVLKSLPTGAHIVRTGGCKVSSRLLRDVRDPMISKLIKARFTSSKSHELMDLRSIYTFIIKKDV